MIICISSVRDKGDDVSRRKNRSAKINSLKTVHKTHMAETIEDYPLRQNNNAGKRGLQIYNAAELIGASGRIESGDRITVTHEMPLFYLTVSERIDIARLCSPVFAVTQGRGSRLAGMEWVVAKQSKSEDRIADKLRLSKSLYREYMGEIDPRSLGIKIKAMSYLKAYLPDVKSDLSNFEACLLRWSKRIRMENEDRCSEIEDWLQHPNPEDSFEDFLKKISFDLHVHGMATPYKQYEGNRIENLYTLPGGTVYPVKGPFIGQATGYIQIVNNFDPQIMFANELSCLRYSPRSDSSYGSVPLEALVNKVAESLMFDQRAAEMADGTKPPEKLVVMGDRSPFGDIGKEFDVGLSKPEQRRVEQVLNEQKKEALRVLTGYGVPTVIDVSRSDTFQFQSERQRMVREEVGLVFGASNMEMNLTGSESTSGRNSSETQERYDLYKGIYPIIQAVERFYNREVFPFRYGQGYELSFKTGLSEREKLAELTEKKNSGLYSVNEIRTRDLGEDPFEGEEFNKPAGTVAMTPAPESAGIL